MLKIKNVLYIVYILYYIYIYYEAKIVLIM